MGKARKRMRIEYADSANLSTFGDALAVIRDEEASDSSLLIGVLRDPKEGQVGHS
jgi:hypothetical protein